MRRHAFFFLIPLRAYLRGVKADRKDHQVAERSPRNVDQGSLGSLSVESIPPRATTLQLTATPLASPPPSHFYKPPGATPEF